MSTSGELTGALERSDGAAGRVMAGAVGLVLLLECAVVVFVAVCWALSP